MLVKAVQVPNVREKYGFRDFGLNGGAVKIDVLAGSVVCAQPQHVPLVGCDEDERGLAEQPEDGRVFLPGPVANLKREREVTVVSKIETHDRMSYVFRAPGRERKV